MRSVVDHVRSVARAPDAEAAIRNTVLILIAGTSLLRLVFAARLGLGIDEAYTVATSRTLQLSTFDHPPLAWWLTWAMRALTGSEAALVVRLPFVAAFALTTWFTFRLTCVLYGLRAGLWAAVAVNIPPVIGWTSGTWVLPDGPLYAALTGGTLAVARVLFTPRASPQLWLLAGLAAGLTMLSKLHGAFLLAGVFLFLLSSPRHRHWLLSPWPYLGAIVALVVFSPVLIWNAEHHWISFTFQAARGQVRQLNISGFLAVLGGQMAYLLPLVWFTLVVLWARALKQGTSHPRDWLLVCIASGPIVLFTISGLWAGRILPHWAVPGYLMLFPLVGRALSRALALAHTWARWWLGLCVGTTAVVIVGVLALTAMPWPRLVVAGKAVPDPLAETLDWHDVPRELARRGLLSRPDTIVVAPRWHEAGKLAVALGPQRQVLCLSQDPRGFGIGMNPARHMGADALIIGAGLRREDVESLYGTYFEQVSELAPITLTRAGRASATANVFLGTKLRRSGRSPDLLDPVDTWGGRLP